MNHSGTFVTTRSAEEAFDLLADPRRFAPLLPDFESMSVMDATHFTMRIVITVGQIRGHVNLAMELIQASRPTQVEYRGSATIAGSPLRMGINFSVNPRAEMTDVTWQGEVTLEGILALVAGNGLETMGRQNFDRMAQRLRLSLQDEQHADDEKKGVELAPEGFDFEI